MHECSLWYARNDFVACRMLKVFGMVRYQKKKKHHMLPLNQLISIKIFRWNFNNA